MELDLFNVPDIRTPVPAAPGSVSSAEGAKAINPFRRGLRREILISLAAVTVPISREELSARMDVKETTLCGRLYELRPTWVAAVPGFCRSTAGVSVDGYILTKAGRAVANDLIARQREAA